MTKYTAIISFDGTYGKAYSFDSLEERKGYIEGYMDGTRDSGGSVMVYPLEVAPESIKLEHEAVLARHKELYG